MRTAIIRVPVCLLLIVASLLAVLAGCAKVNAPQTGDYRAEIALSGGMVPMLLRISSNNGQTQMAVVNKTESTLATQVQIVNGVLLATLPDEMGELHAKFDAHGMSGELRLGTDKKLKLPFIATRNANYCFFEKSLTDNVDASGRWTIHADALSTNITNAQLVLTQHYDQIDGELGFANHKLRIVGQARGDDVFLAAMGANQVWLLKGGFNQQGVFAGQLWHNTDAAVHWSAARVGADNDSQAEPLSPIILPWAVPTR